MQVDFPIQESYQIGRYKVRRKVGAGAMAMVVHVWDTLIRADRAMKILSPEYSMHLTIQRRFRQEATVMADLQHPNIVRVFDIGFEAHQPFFTMELAEDGNLLDVMRRRGRPFKPRQAMAIAFDVLRGLGHAHSSNIVHRDVKPSNLLATGSGAVKLCDFGIARVESEARLTGMGDMLGSRAYMAPEQRMDPRLAEPRSDLYSVGATVFQLITGKRPPDLSAAALDPSMLERLPEAARPVILRACAYKPDQRFVDARAMAADMLVAWNELPEDDKAGPAPKLEHFDDITEDTTIIWASDPPDAVIEEDEDYTLD